MSCSRFNTLYYGAVTTNQINAFIGIDLRHYESGNFLAKEHITKRGNPYARKILFKCSQANDGDKIIKAPVPKAPLAHSLGSASIIAHTIHQKFNLKVPNYRQEEDWAKMGLSISRKAMANWHIKSSQYYFEAIYDLLREKLLEQPILHADETSYKVLESDSQLTYYWTFLSGKHEEQGITLYHHDKRRSGLMVKEFLGNYDGYIHCDMWGAYRQLEKAELVGCWAHVRRKFFEATPKKADKRSLGAKGLAYCNQMFGLESSWEKLSAEERLKKRQEELKPLMETFFYWCRSQAVLSGSKLENLEELLTTVSSMRKLLRPF